MRGPMCGKIYFSGAFNHPTAKYKGKFAAPVSVLAIVA